MKKLLSILSVFIVKFLLFTFSFLPKKAITPISTILGLFFYTIKLKKNTIATNWSYIFNRDISKKELKTIYINTARNFIETIFLFTSSSETVLQFFKFTKDEQLLVDNVHNNAVFITMHYANWEVIGCYLAINYTPFYPIYKKLTNQYFEKLMMDVRKKFNMFPVESRQIVKMMKKEPEKLYAFIIDQNLRQGRYYSFLGKETLITDVPIKLSLKNQKTLLIGYPIRDKEGRFTIDVMKIDTRGMENNQENIDNIMQEICDYFSIQIKKDPFQWFGWLHKFWKSTPENELSGIYTKGKK